MPVEVAQARRSTDFRLYALFVPVPVKPFQSNRSPINSGTSANLSNADARFFQNACQYGRARPGY
jgi:hypothetical protein